MAREPFPLAAGVAAIIATGAGLAFAASEVKWGAAPSSTDALPFAWIYVNCALAMMWLVIWPCIAAGTRPELLWQFAAIILGSIPAFSVAADLSGEWRSALSMCSLQLGIGILAMGVLALDKTLAAGVLTTIGVVLPIGVYVWAEFFPAALTGWFSFVPLVAIVRGVNWGVAGCYAVIGLICFAAATQPRGKTTG